LIGPRLPYRDWILSSAAMNLLAPHTEIGYHLHRWQGVSGEIVTDPQRRKVSMAPIGTALSGIAWLGTFICFILVLVQMFQRGETTLGIVCIVLACCGFGFLIAFIYGWVKSGQWGIQNIMLIWTGCIVLSIVGGALNPAQFQQFQQLPGFKGP
jgi:hypothetical protein